MVGHISLITVHSTYASTSEFFSNQDRSNLLPVAEVPNVDVLAMVPCCFHSLSTQTFRIFYGGRQMRRDKKCPFKSVTIYGRFWRKGTWTWGLECDQKAVISYFLTIAYSVYVERWRAKWEIEWKKERKSIAAASYLGVEDLFWILY